MKFQVNLKKLKFPLNSVKRFILYDSIRWDIETRNAQIIKLPSINYNKSLKNYLDIFNQMPIAVFNRNEKLYNPLTSIVAEKFKNNQIKLSDAKLIFTKSPAWIFIRDFNVSESSTAIRNNK